VACPLDLVVPLLVSVARPLLVPLEASPRAVSLVRHLLVSLVVEDPLVGLVSRIDISGLFTCTLTFLLSAGFAPPPGFAPQGAPRKSFLAPLKAYQGIFLNANGFATAGAFQPPPGFQPPGQGRGYPPPGFPGR
jgi:hypothetical protein